jgi:hypothetical protein
MSHCNKQHSGKFFLAVRSAIESLEQRVLLSYNSRGKISLIADERLFNPNFHTATEISEIRASLHQYKQDLIGDGWMVSMHTDAPHMLDDFNVWDNSGGHLNAHAVSSTTTQYRNDLQTVKNMIADDAEDHTLKAVVIVGHVTVPYSGTTNYDVHGERAMPTDQYYSDLDATPVTWGDYKKDVSTFSGDHGTYKYEFTPNRPHDGRFDAEATHCAG